MVLAEKLNNFEGDYLRSRNEKGNAVDLEKQFKMLIPDTVTPECLAELMKYLEHGELQKNGPGKVVVLRYAKSWASLGINADGKTRLPSAMFNKVWPLDF